MATGEEDMALVISSTFRLLLLEEEEEAANKREFWSHSIYENRKTCLLW